MKNFAIIINFEENNAFRPKQKREPLRVLVLTQYV